MHETRTRPLVWYVTPPFLTSGTRRRLVVSFAPLSFYPRPGTHYIVDWVGHRAVLSTTKKNEFSCPYRESNPDSSDAQPLV
jgi:hypothetical protein